MRPACGAIILPDGIDPSIALSQVRVDYCSKVFKNAAFLCESTTALKIGACQEDSLKKIQFQSAPEQKSSPVSLVACPLGHSARDFLACDFKSSCWSRDIKTCLAPLTPLPPSFTCTNGVEHVPYTLVCDVRPDCSDDSDEKFCVYPPCDLPGAFLCNDFEVRLMSDESVLVCGKRHWCNLSLSVLLLYKNVFSTRFLKVYISSERPLSAQFQHVSYPVHAALCLPVCRAVSVSYTWQFHL